MIDMSANSIGDDGSVVLAEALEANAGARHKNLAVDCGC